MAESNGVCFIGRRLIADSRAVFRGYNCLIASCQCICRIFASRTASKTYRIHTIYAAVIASIVIFSISANRGCSCSKCIVSETAKDSGLYAVSNIIAATSSCRTFSGSCIITSTDCSRPLARSIVVVAANNCSVNARSNIVHAAGCDTACSRGQAVLAADRNSIITRSAIGYFRIILVAGFIFCITAKNQSCIIHLYSYLFIALMFFIRIVGPQIAVQADGILCLVCGIGSNLDAETGLVPTEFFRQFLQLTDRSYICSGSTVSDI